MKKITAIISILAAFCAANAATNTASSVQAQKSATVPAAYKNAGAVKASDFVSARGTNFVALGGFGGNSSLYAFGDRTDSAVAGATAELNVNVFKSDDDVYGLDLAVPFSYSYCSQTYTDSHVLQVPLQFRPYYRVYSDDNFVITPYFDGGIGGAFGFYRGVNGESFSQNSMFLIWNLGGGVEVSFCKDFSITPKYSYNRSGDNTGFSYTHNVGGEFAWKFTKNMVLSVEYVHEFGSGDYGMTTSTDSGFLKVRYEF